MCEARAPHGVMETHSPGPCPSVHGFAHSWMLHLIHVRLKVTTERRAGLEGELRLSLFLLAGRAGTRARVYV